MKSVKNKIIIMSGIILLAMSVTILAGCGSNIAQSPGTQTNAAPSATASAAGTVQGTDTDGDGIPDSIEKTYGTNPYSADTDGDGTNDKQDNEPVFADNPINETATAELPIVIKDARVEDNATADHLEISITNNGKSELTNFDIYYTITDKVTNKKEAYYQKLSGLSVKPGETQTIHFDNNVSQPGHYYGNMNGLYGTSSNGLTFDVILHSAGFKPCEFTVEKAKGTAEVAD